jgi:hypothetical protein
MDLTSNAEWIACSCCGKGILDTPEENTYHGKEPYPCDLGMGMCVECGGDPSLNDMTIIELEQLELPEEEFWRKMGSAYEMFFRSRVDILRKNVDEDKFAKFDALSLPRKCYVVSLLIEKGAMI